MSLFQRSLSCKQLTLTHLLFWVLFIKKCSNSDAKLSDTLLCTIHMHILVVCTGIFSNNCVRTLCKLWQFICHFTTLSIYTCMLHYTFWYGHTNMRHASTIITLSLCSNARWWLSDTETHNVIQVYIDIHCCKVAETEWKLNYIN